MWNEGDPMNETIRCAGCEAGLYLNKYGIHESFEEPSSVCERAKEAAAWKCACPAPDNVRSGPGMCGKCFTFPARRPW
jgi:hypothetical protein